MNLGPTGLSSLTPGNEHLEPPIHCGPRAPDCAASRPDAQLGTGMGSQGDARVGHQGDAWMRHQEDAWMRPSVGSSRSPSQATGSISSIGRAQVSS